MGRSAPVRLTQRNYRSRAAALISACALVLFATGAAPATCSPAKTKVAMGERVEPTGDTQLDTFFSDLHELDQAAKNVDEEQRAALREAAPALGLEPEADLDEFLDAATQKSASLKESGMLLHLQLTPEPKVVSALEPAKKPAKPAPRAKDDAEPPADEAGLKALETITKKALDLARKLDELTARAESLQAKRSELARSANITLKHKSTARRSEVMAELEAAQEVLQEAAESTRKQAGLTSKFVLDLARALETGAAQVPPPASANPSRPAWAAGRGQGPARGKPVGGGAKPAPKPRPKPAGGDDFDR